MAIHQDISGHQTYHLHTLHNTSQYIVLSIFQELQTVFLSYKSNKLYTESPSSLFFV